MSNKMTPTLKTEKVMWKTVTVGCQRYTLEVYLEGPELERIISEKITPRLEYLVSHYGPIRFDLTRQS